MRNIKGVLGDINSLKEESFSEQLIEYPQYEIEKTKLGNVPEVLLSGDHKKIKIWRKKQSLEELFLLRRDIFPKELGSDDFKLLKEFLSDLGYESDRIADLLQNIKKMTSSRKSVQIVEASQLKKDIAEFSQETQYL